MTWPWENFEFSAAGKRRAPARYNEIMDDDCEAMRRSMVDRQLRARGIREAARARLAALEIQNVHFDLRNGYLGWPEAAPFDRIMVTAGGTFVPQPLVDQLAPSGRMIIPVGSAHDDQVLKLLIKQDAFRVDI